MSTPLAQVLLLEIRKAVAIAPGVKYTLVQLIDDSLLHCRSVTFQGNDAELTLLSGTKFKLPVAALTWMMKDADNPILFAKFKNELAQKSKRDRIVIMRDTIHCLTDAEPDQAAITQSVHRMVVEVQQYVPGYRLKNGPIFDGNRVSVFMEVEGLGDYLPRYAGNLDIMTAAAARTGEMFACELLEGSRRLIAA